MSDAIGPQEPRILLVDDDPGTIKILAQILKHLGKIHFTTQSTEAVALAHEVSPDIILLDVEMPDMHGFDLCKLIKHSPALAEIPILFLTAHIDQALEVLALRTGAIDFIHKPPHPEIISARVRNYLTLKLRTDQLQQLTLLDGLTAIPNRRAFDKAIMNECRRTYRNQSPLSLLLIDVDHFKRYNDSHGHPAGDTCLRAVASCLKTKTRRPGDMVARYGGEEFIVLLPDCPLRYATELAESIRRELSEIRGPLASPITASIGVASTEHACQQADPSRQSSANPCETETASLIQRADQALYRAKHTGRNRVCADDPEAPAP